MHGCWVVNGAANLMFSKVPHQGVATPASDDIKMVDVLSVCAFLRRCYRQSLKTAPVSLRYRRASRIILVKMRELCVENRRLQRVESRIKSGFARLPGIIPAVLTQPAYALGDFWLPRQNYSAVADRAEIFSRIE